MPNNYAETPKNPWGIAIPAAVHGAQQLPIPQPATMGELQSEAYHAKLKAAVSAQIEANAKAFQDEKARKGAQPYRPSSPGKHGGGANSSRTPAAATGATVPMPSVPLAQPAATAPIARSPNYPADVAGAAAASVLPTGAGYAAQGSPAKSSASLFDQEYERGRAEASALLAGEGLKSATVLTRPAARPAATGTQEQQEAIGAAAVVALIGTPEQQRANRAAQSPNIGAGGPDAAAGAAEARRLLGQN